MYIISFHDFFTLDLWIPLGRHLVSFEPHKPYFFSDYLFEQTRKMPTRLPIEKISAADPVLRPLNVIQHPPPRDIAFYMGVGGMGDNIMARVAVRELAERGYKVHLICLPVMEFAWQAFPWSESMTFLPCYWSLIDRFEHHVIFEAISNSYVHEKQAHPVDAMLGKLGIDPASVPKERKRIPTTFTKQELVLAHTLYPGKRLGFIQLAPSQQARKVPPMKMREIIWALSEAFPELHWIVIAGGGVPQHYYDPPIEAPNVETRSFDRLRTLWALLTRAEVCVSPDTMLVHAAGIAGVPCVGLWGTYPYQSRVAYYEDHLPIFHQEACSRSPCNWNADGLPTFCPPTTDGSRRQFCAVLEAIQPEEVVEAVRSVRRSPKLPPPPSSTVASPVASPQRLPDEAGETAPG